MSASRGAHKVERVTVTLVPRGDMRSAIHVPSTFNHAQHTYGWRRAEGFEYMVVPTRVSSKEVRIDLFLTFAGRHQAKEVQKFVRTFVEEKVDTEWKGLKLGTVGRPGVALPPRETIVRGAIEDIMGADLEH